MIPVDRLYFKPPTVTSLPSATGRRSGRLAARRPGPRPAARRTARSVRSGAPTPRRPQSGSTTWRARPARRCSRSPPATSATAAGERHRNRAVARREGDVDIDSPTTMPGPAPARRSSRPPAPGSERLALDPQPQRRPRPPRAALAPPTGRDPASGSPAAARPPHHPPALSPGANLGDPTPRRCRNHDHVGVLACLEEESDTRDDEKSVSSGWALAPAATSRRFLYRSDARRARRRCRRGSSARRSRPLPAPRP